MQPYLGEIRMFGGPFAPQGWAFCDGRELAIANYRDLYGLIGTTYGGDGTSNFKLPDMRGRVPISKSANSGADSPFPLGASAGMEAFTLDASQLAAHSHPLSASGAAANTRMPAGNALGVAAGTIYTSNPGRGLSSMNAAAVDSVGGGQPHTNLQPYLCVSFIIALNGITPSATSATSDGEPFIGEIRMFSFGVAPPGWLLCDGRTFPVFQGETIQLQTVISEYFGGDGMHTFALPNLLGCAPVFWQQGPGLSPRHLGERGGVPAVNIEESQMPAHTHQLSTSTEPGNTNTPAGAFTGTGTALFAPPDSLQPMAQMLAHAGHGDAHNNMMPYLTVYFCIAVRGFLPPHSDEP
jgi:microcystin-dependent protein